MSTPLIIGLTLLLLVLTAFWAMARTRRIREAASQREEEALARVRAGANPLMIDGDTVFDPAGLPSRMPERRGIEVAEHDEVVDLEALLAGEPQGVARRARATLEEPTDIVFDSDTLPPAPRSRPEPVPAVPVSAAPAPAAAMPARPMAAAHPMTAPVDARAAATPLAVKPAAAPAASASAAAQATPRPAVQPAPQAVAHPAQQPIAPAAVARAAQPSPPTLVARLPESVSAAATAPASLPPLPAVAPSPTSGGAPIRGGNDDVPLRELALAWFEARGYRSAPASSAVRPIEQVLRHRHDPARAYAFVMENQRVTAERVQQLRTQARSIGLLRVLIVANAGADDGAATKSKGVRLMDRASLAAEFDQLDFSVAAKIIAVARKRAGVPTTVH
jgi:hypothetical protein